MHIVHRLDHLDLTVIVSASSSYCRRSRGNLSPFPGALCLPQLCLRRNLSLFLGALCLPRSCLRPRHYTN
jgi:hypothetical protein